MNKKQGRIGWVMVTIVPTLLIGGFAFWRAREPKEKPPQKGNEELR
ncbi:MAG: hypothetical protein ABSG21_15940 [Spirochaetia bacterium]|jgi:hypothetical protein